MGKYMHTPDKKESPKTETSWLGSDEEKYVFVLISYKECIATFPNCFLYADNMKDDQKGRKHKWNNGSGYAVAFFGLIRGSADETGVRWDRSHITALKKCKSNICESKNAHFGSNV